MDKEAVLDAVSRFREELGKQGVTVERMVLFGSWARGNPREGSDIDLVVVSEDFAGKGYWERIDILAAAIYEVFEPIEAVAMTPSEWESGLSPIAQYARDGQQV